MKTAAKRTAVGLASLALLCALPLAQAAAQTGGAYAGHTADGNAISFYIGTDVQGQPALMDLAIKFTAACGQSGSSISQSWHFFFSGGLPIVNGHVKHLENNPQLYLLNSLSVHGNQVTGSTEARLPVLNGGKSGAVQVCAAGKQAFEASFQSPDGAGPFDHT